MSLVDFPWPIFPSIDAEVFQGVAGEQITAGQAVYWNRDDRRLYLATCLGYRHESLVRGLALNSAYAIGQAVQVLIAGAAEIGSGGVLESLAPIFQPGRLYLLGNTGTLISNLDQPSGSYTSVVGVGGGAKRLLMHVFPTGNKFLF